MTLGLHVLADVSWLAHFLTLRVGAAGLIRTSMLSECGTRLGEGKLCEEVQELGTIPRRGPSNAIMGGVLLVSPTTMLPSVSPSLESERSEAILFSAYLPGWRSRECVCVCVCKPNCWWASKRTLLALPHPPTLRLAVSSTKPTASLLAVTAVHAYLSRHHAKSRLLSSKWDWRSAESPQTPLDGSCSPVKGSWQRIGLIWGSCTKLQDNMWCTSFGFHLCLGVLRSARAGSPQHTHMRRSGIELGLSWPSESWSWLDISLCHMWGARDIKQHSIGVGVIDTAHSFNLSTHCLTMCDKAIASNHNKLVVKILDCDKHQMRIV